MRTLLLLLTMVAGCHATSHAREPVTATAGEIRADDLRQINGIFEQWQAAWNTHDMHTFAQLFHEDATWIVWTGRVWSGRKAIENGHVEVHKTFFRDSTQSSRSEQIRLVAPGVVVARSLTTLKGDSREPQATIYGHKLLVITKRGEAWRILYGQNTRLTPAVVATVR